MKIGVFGPQFQSQHIIELLKHFHVDCIDINKTLSGENLIKKYKQFIKTISKVDTVYTIGQSFRFNPKIVISKILGKKVISHWIGSDILEAKKNRFHKINQWFIDINLSCSELIQNELFDMGIASELLPIIPAGMSYDIAIMPKRHSVLVYLPEGNEEFYGKKFVEFLALEYPDIEFKIVANTNKNILNFKNVFFLGRLSFDEMEKLYDEISILLRLPEHDGLSLMLLEALAKGKEVIYKYPFPYTHTASNLTELKIVFSKIVSSEPKVNYEANEYIRNNYNQCKIYNDFKRIISL